MSRGLGNLQDEVIGLLSATDTELTVESLQWAIFEASHRSEPKDDLPHAFYKSLWRSVKRLQETGRVNIHRRRLKNLKECEAHFPGKTSNGLKRALRKRYLPMLCYLIGTSPDFVPGYNRAENELFHRMNQPAETMQLLKDRWQKFSEALRPVYGSTRGPADELLLLICRGRQLFDPAGIEVASSFGNAIERIAKLDLVEPTLARDLQEFYRQFLSNEQSGFLRMKSQIGGLATIGRNGEYPLTGKTLAALHSQDSEFIERLPGFHQKPRPYAPLAWQAHYPQREYEYPKELVNLFDPTVFQKYKFISLPN